MLRRATVLTVFGAFFILSRPAAAEKVAPGPAVAIGYDAAAILAAPDGSLYVTGGIVSPPEARVKAVTSHHLADGTRLWEQTQRDVQYPTEDHNTLVGTKLAQDAMGNLIVVAATNCYAGFHGGFTIMKYDSAGTLQWVKYCDFRNYSYAPPYGLGVDADGNIYIATYLVNFKEGPAPVAVIVRYDPQGELFTTLTLPEMLRTGLTGNNDNHRLGVAVDGAGNLFVAGPGGLVKFDAAGNQIWSASPPVPGTGWSAVAVGLDPSGNVFLTGSGGTFKFDASGTPLWHDVAGTGSALAADASGNVIVTGSAGTRKYAPLGALLWQLDAGATAVATSPGAVFYLLNGKNVASYTVN